MWIDCPHCCGDLRMQRPYTRTPACHSSGKSFMDRFRISRRALMLSAGAFAAWQVSPVRALMQSAEREGALPQKVDALIGRMTLEEKAGQLTLMPAAWDANAATFNPSQPLTSFRAQLGQIRAGQITGAFNGSGPTSVREAQTAAVKESR